MVKRWMVCLGSNEGLLSTNLYNSREEATASLKEELLIINRNFHNKIGAVESCDTGFRVSVDVDDGLLYWGSAKELLFELTPDERETAYRTQQEEYRLNDAADHFYQVIGYDPYLDDEEQKDVIQEFSARYGCSISEVVDYGSDYYLLRAFLDKYEDSLDCNIDENSLWEECIKTVLNQFEAGEL